MPDAGPARRRRLARILTAAGVFAVAAGAAVWLLRKAPAESARVPAREAPVAVAVTALPLATPAPAPSAAPAGAVTRSPRPTPPPAAMGEPGVPPAASAAPAPPAPRAQALADGKTYPGSVALPGGAKIELGGIVWSETEPRALLNDRIVGVDAWVEGFTLTKIEPERVALEKDGLTIFLSLK